MPTKSVPAPPYVWVVFEVAAIAIGVGAIVALAAFVYDTWRGPLKQWTPAVRLRRFRIRTLMLAVAVVGMALGVETMHHRQVECQGQANRYRAEVRDVGDYMTPESRAWCVEMAEFYERASRRPWLPLPPEPPEPK